jgi:hypothetical protein
MNTGQEKRKGTPRLIGVHEHLLPPDVPGDDAVPGWDGEMRIVHCQRARTLRRRGEDVRYVERTKTGRARYVWFVEQMRADRRTQHGGAQS